MLRTASSPKATATQICRREATEGDISCCQPNESALAPPSTQTLALSLFKNLYLTKDLDRVVHGLKNLLIMFLCTSSFFTGPQTFCTALSFTYFWHSSFSVSVTHSLCNISMPSLSSFLLLLHLCLPQSPLNNSPWL